MQQQPKAYLPVAGQARIRGTTCGVFGDKVVNNCRPELLFMIDEVERNAQQAGYAACIVDALRRTAAIGLAGFGRG